MIKELLLVGLGGGAGSAARYLCSTALGRICTGAFPGSTFAVNAAGCLLMGLLFGLSEKSISMNGEMKLLLATGFCGGYTTFSAFSAENVKLLQEGRFALAFLYASTSVLAGLTAFAAGILLSKLYKTQ
ncbi:MAG: fluoride efflux transporter CrcB [Prevotellaceae bacterium]|jgi:CrcB protein|nr:fluoride efflux transporter CrcB [Prevotellaceae bacterium]